MQCLHMVDLRQTGSTWDKLGLIQLKNKVADGQDRGAQGRRLNLAGLYEFGLGWKMSLEGLAAQPIGWIGGRLCMINNDLIGPFCWFLLYSAQFVFSRWFVLSRASLSKSLRPFSGALDFLTSFLQTPCFLLGSKVFHT